MFDNRLWRSVDGRYVVSMRLFAARTAWISALNALVTNKSDGRTYLDDAVSMWRREVHRDALPDLPDDELVRVMTGGNVVDVVDIAQWDDLCRLAGKQVGDW